MADNKKKKNTSAKKPENKSSDSLESFLGREQAPKKQDNKNGKKKINKKIVIPVAAAAAVLVLVGILIFLNSRPAPTMDQSTVKEAVFVREVGENGEHTVTVPLNDKGEVGKNGFGELLTYVPSEISRIDVENANGSFSVLSSTPEGEATVYTLVGFEDSALQAGIADEIATDASVAKFTQIISVKGDDFSDFGLDKPRATVKVSYNDKTTATILIGNEAAGGVGTYFTFGSSGVVFLADNDTVDSYLYDVTEFISLTINDSAADTDSSEFKTLTISGSRYPEPITLKPNTDDALNAVYVMTAPLNTPASSTEAYDIAGNIRGLYAESVVAVNPSESRLKELGFDKPYASVEAEYPDCKVVLHASKPDDNGIVNLYNPDKNTVYTIQLAAVCWAKTSVEALMPEMVFDVKIESVSRVDFSSASKNMSFPVTVTTKTVKDDNDIEQQVTTVKATYNDKVLSEDNFRTFFQNLNAIKNAGAAKDENGKSVMKFSVSYSNGRDTDSVEAFTYSADNSKYLIKLDGKTVGLASSSYIDKLIESAAALSNGETVPGL